MIFCESSAPEYQAADKRGCTRRISPRHAGGYMACLSAFIRIHPRFHLMSISCLLIACAAPGKGPSPIVTAVPAPYRADATLLDKDPVAFLRQLKERCDTLDHYSLTFYRQERLGLIPSLQPMEIIQAKFRRDPFSVKFEWADEEMPYYESVYVEGRNENKLVIRERKGIFPFPPTVRMVDVDLPAKLGKAKNPITSFGLAQLVTRTLGPLDDPAIRDVTTARYLGLIQLEPQNVPAHHLRIEHPPAPGYRYTAQDFYIDARTGLPAGTNLWLPDGQLDTLYRYADVDPAVRLSDVDFHVSKKQTAASRPATQAPPTTRTSTNP